MTARPADAGPVVVVGGGLAGATAVTTLVKAGYAGPITVVAGEPHAPYERPPLSKGYLLGTAPRDDALVHPAAWYGEHGVDLRTGVRATAVDRGTHLVHLADGTALPYAHLLLATGSRPRMLTVPGASLPGVHYLRTLEDADALVQALGRTPHVAVIGGGWIGLEVAAAARQAGCDVTVLEAGPVPLGRVLGPELGGMFADLHREHGVDVRTQVQVAALDSEDGDHVRAVRLGDGSHVRADLVVVGVGIVPEVGLAQDAGLEVGDGVLVDTHLRTSDPDVLAAGDVASALHPALGRRLRVEHWANAVRQGEVAASTILGEDAVDLRLPYFWTDQYDLGMEYVGHVDPARSAQTTLVVRGSLTSRELIAFWVDEHRVVAGMNVNVWDVSEQIEALIRSGRQVDPRRLADPDVALDAL